MSSAGDAAPPLRTFCFASFCRALINRVLRTTHLGILHLNPVVLLDAVRKQKVASDKMTSLGPGKPVFFFERLTMGRRSLLPDDPVDERKNPERSMAFALPLRRWENRRLVKILGLRGARRRKMERNLSESSLSEGGGLDFGASQLGIDSQPRPDTPPAPLC
jgi:hypothetical protein